MTCRRFRRSGSCTERALQSRGQPIGSARAQGSFSEAGTWEELPWTGFTLTRVFSAKCGDCPVAAAQLRAAAPDATRGDVSGPDELGLGVPWAPLRLMPPCPLCFLPGPPVPPPQGLVASQDSPVGPGVSAALWAFSGFRGQLFKSSGCRDVLSASLRTGDACMRSWGWEGPLGRLGCRRLQSGRPIHAQGFLCGQEALARRAMAGQRGCPFGIWRPLREFK